MSEAIKEVIWVLALTAGVLWVSILLRQCSWIIQRG